MDIFDKVVNNMGALGQFADIGYGYYFFPKLEGEISNKMKFKGREMLVWSLNNYLGLANLKPGIVGTLMNCVLTNFFSFLVIFGSST